MTTATTLRPGRWVADPVHSDVTIKVRHMGVGRVRGTFTLTSAELTLGADEGDAAVHAVIDAASVDTGARKRDEHIRSGDFLDVAAYPTIEFNSTDVRDFDGQNFTLAGDLSIHGVTRTVALAAEFLGVVDDPSGVQRGGFSASTRISRADFGVDIQLAFGAGEAVVADTIDIAIEIEFTSEAQA